MGLNSTAASCTPTTTRYSLLALQYTDYSPSNGAQVAQTFTTIATFLHRGHCRQSSLASHQPRLDPPPLLLHLHSRTGITSTFFPLVFFSFLHFFPSIVSLQ